MPLPTTMKAWRLPAFGKDGDSQAAIDSLEMKDTPLPQLQEKQVLIGVAYAAVNPVDSLLFTGGMHGMFPSPCPYTRGFDVSGVVVASRGERLKEGDRVCAFIGLVESCREGATFGPAGAFAEYCAVPEDQVALCGDVALDVAAALPLSGLTAFQALFTGGHTSALGNVGKGSKVVVLGGPTAVGAHAIQLAAACGAEVFTTASKNQMPSGQSKIDFCKELGATVFNYKEVDWSEELKGHNVELIFDCGGDNKDWLNASKVLAPGGRFLTVSNMAPDPPEMDGRPCEFFAVHSVRRDLEELLGAVAAGRHKVPIDSCEDFGNLQVQLNKSRKGAAAGKLMVEFPGAALVVPVPCAAAPVVPKPYPAVVRYGTVPGKYMAQYEAMPVGGPRKMYVDMPVEPPMMYEAAPAASSPVVYAAAPVQCVQPSVYPISAERFAQVAAGIPLTREEIDAMTGAVTAEAASAAVAAPAAVQSAAKPAPLVKSEKKERSSPKKKSLKGSKKKSKACC